jgi:V/A-type H+-transporting ATPase subunit D
MEKDVLATVIEIEKEIEERLESERLKAVQWLDFAKREIEVEIAEKSIMGLRYRDLTAHESALRSPAERGYDYLSTTPHLEESIHLFEMIVDSMREIASFDSKLKRLSADIQRIARRIRVLEERILPALQGQIKFIAQYIAEREREAYYRLKRFKEVRTA